MKVQTKRISLALALVLMLGVLTACGGGYKDDVPLSDIESAIDSAAGVGSSMMPAPDTYVTGMVKLTDADYTDACIKMDSQGININEYGIFHTSGEEQAKALKGKLDEYLTMRKDTWMTGYMPEELPKLENATVTVCGNYVLYAILDDAGRVAAAEAFEKAVK